MTFFAFPKLKWLLYIYEMGIVLAVDVKFSQDLTHKNH